MGLLIRTSLMPVPPTPGRNRRQCAGVTVLCRYLPHHILARPRLAPDVGKAEEMLDPTCPRLCVLRTYVVSNAKAPASCRDASVEHNIIFSQACDHSALRKPMIPASSRHGFVHPGCG